MIRRDFLRTEPGRPVQNTSLDTPAQLPAKLVVDRPARLEFKISDDLPRWDRATGGTWIRTWAPMSSG